MNAFRVTVSGLLVSATLGLSACENIALIRRPDVDDESGRRSDRELARDSRVPDADRNRDSRRNEIVGTIERIDESNREIRLRTTEGRMMVVKYDPATMVYNRDREVGIEALRNRDQVLVRLSTNSRGDEYADTIRLNDAGTFGARSY
jgi:hypothetical protein